MDLNQLFDKFKIIDLKDNQCKYPTPLHQTVGGVTLFCGRQAVPGKSWCKEHKSRVSYTRQEQIIRLKTEDKRMLNKLSIAQPG